VLGVLTVERLVMVEVKLGTGSHHLVEEEEVLGLLSKGKECASSMRGGIAKKELHAIISTLESFLNFV